MAQGTRAKQKSLMDKNWVRHFHLYHKGFCYRQTKHYRSKYNMENNRKQRPSKPEGLCAIPYFCILLHNLMIRLGKIVEWRNVMKKFNLFLIALLSILVAHAKAVTIKTEYELVSYPEVLSKMYNAPQTISKGNFEALKNGEKLEEKWSFDRTGHFSFAEKFEGCDSYFSYKMQEGFTLEEDVTFSESYLYRMHDTFNDNTKGWLQSCFYKIKEEFEEFNDKHKKMCIHYLVINAYPSIELK